jgi:hypothetical protein
MSEEREPATIEIRIEGDVEGGLNIVAERVDIFIGGAVCGGGITIRQVPLSNPDDLLVEIDGERVEPG